MKLSKIICIAVLLLAMLNLSFAQYDVNQGEYSGSRERMTSRPQTSQTSGKGQILSTDELLGSDVKDRNGETLGSVKECIGDSSQSNVKYIVLEADKLHPVPWSACEVKTHKSSMDTNDVNDQNKTRMSWGMSRKESKLVLNISKDQLQNAPSVDSLDIEKFSDSSLQQKVDSFYSQHTLGASRIGRSSSPESAGTSRIGQSGSLSRGTNDDANMTQSRGMTAGAANLFKASEIIGIDVSNMQDETMGEIKDLVIDSTKGNFAYGLVSFGGVLGVGEKVAAVPWSVINIDTQQKTAKLDATTDKLQMAVLEGGDISKLSQKQFASRIFETFGTEPYWTVYGYEPPEESESESMDSNDLQRRSDDVQRQRDDVQRRRDNGDPNRINQGLY